MGIFSYFDVILTYTVLVQLYLRMVEGGQGYVLRGSMCEYRPLSTHTRGARKAPPHSKPIRRVPTYLRECIPLFLPFETFLGLYYQDTASVFHVKRFLPSFLGKECTSRSNTIRMIKITHWEQPPRTTSTSRAREIQFSVNECSGNDRTRLRLYVKSQQTSLNKKCAPDFERFGVVVLLRTV